MLLNKAFWLGTLERALKTAAQVLGVNLLGTGAAEVGFDVIHADWATAGSFAAGAAILSVVFSIGSGRFTGPDGSPSLVQDRPRDW